MKLIVTAIDFSEVSNDIIELTAELAAALAAEVLLIHVAAPNPDFVGYEAGPQSERDARARELRGEHEELHRLAEQLHGKGLRATPLLIQGPTVEKIVDEIRRVEADLAVVGSHGRGALYRALLGSVSQGLIRAAPCPVVVVPARRG